MNFIYDIIGEGKKGKIKKRPYLYHENNNMEFGQDYGVNIELWNFIQNAEIEKECSRYQVYSIIQHNEIEKKYTSYKIQSIIGHNELGKRDAVYQAYQLWG